MWKVALFSLAAMLSIVQGSPLSVAAWNRMLAEIMQVNSGICGNRCFIDVGGQTHVWRQGDRFVHESNPCVEYICKSSRVDTETVQCQEAACANNAPPIIYPGRCCEQCEGGSPDEPGEFEPWGEWTSCTRSCGGGRRARKRECKIGDGSVFVRCTGHLQETEDCNNDPCPIGCRWEYGEFGTCSATCGNGERLRFPMIIQTPQHGGQPCPPNVENNVPDSEPCNLRPCPIPCVWEYGEFGICSKTCGGGTRSRFPRIITPAQHGGSCPAHVLSREPNTETCNENPCPVPCVWEFGEFGLCSETCGGGTRSRLPRIITPAQHGGFCPAHVINGEPNTETCNEEPCPVPCTWEWGEFSVCTKTCGGGTASRLPKLIRPAQHGGSCPQNVVDVVPDTRPCNENPCPVPCEWTWGEFGDCSKTCGGGSMRRFAILVEASQHGGSCPPFVLNGVPDIQPCSENPCPVPCIWEWGKFGECSQTCGGGTMMRIPVISREAQNGGECPLHVVNRVSESEGCNTMECPPSCETGEHPCLINGVFVCIKDADKDCIADGNDNCKFVYNPDQADMEFDGVGDLCDNCPKTSNPDQMNSDGDATGNACDGDDDNDGIDDAADNCQLVVNREQLDADGDRVGDICDNCPNRGNTNQNDADRDGVGNVCDNCRFFANPDQEIITDRQKCTTKPAYMMDDDYNDDDKYMNDKKGLAAELMEKLLEMYYSN